MNAKNKMIGGLLLMIPALGFTRDGLDTHYDYVYDNADFSAHQEQVTAKKSDYTVRQTYFTAKQGTAAYDYHQATVSKTFRFDNVQVEAGPGVLYTDRLLPAYYLDVNYQPNDKSNVEFSADRSALMAANVAQGVGAKITNNYLDNMTLAADYTVGKFTVVVGGFQGFISDGNIRNGFLAKEIFQIDDNWALKLDHRITFYDQHNPNYFSPQEYQQHWLTVNYVKPFWDDNAVLKLSAGPGIVKVNDRTEVGYIYEAKIIGNVNGVKPEIHFGCRTSVYNYEYCDVGASINIPF